MIARSRSLLRSVRGGPSPDATSPRVARRAGAAAVTLATLAVITGCGGSGGTFHEGVAAPARQDSARGAQVYCDPEQPEFQRVDVLSTVVLREPTEPGSTDSVGGEAKAVATLAGQFCGATEFRGFIAVVAETGIPDGAGFRVLAGTRGPDAGARGFGLLVVPADSSDPMQYVVSTDDNPPGGVTPGSGLRGLTIVALGPGNTGTLDDDSHASEPNPRRDGALGQDFAREGPLTKAQMRALAVATAAERADRLGIRR